MNLSIRLILIPMLVSVLNGCSSFLGAKDHLDQYEQQLISNDCDYTLINDRLDNDPLLWNLNGGALARQCKDYQKSIEYLDQAEEIFKQQELALPVEGISNSIASTLINNNVNNYQGENHEKIMMNIYKGLNFMSLQDFDNARIEFNRALDRQRRAAEFFEQEIDNAYQEYHKSTYQQEIYNPIQTASNLIGYPGDIRPEITYPDFINPFATYLSGLFFYIDGDYSKAQVLFKQTALMLPNQNQVQQDLKLAEQHSAQNSHYVWLIYENGQGMIKRSFTYRFPSYLFTDKVITTDISLPTIYQRKSSFPYLLLNQSATKEIANMDTIIQTEFNKKSPAIIAQAMLNMVAKSAIQYSLETRFEEHHGKWLGYLYQIATDTADIRQWRSMPKNFQVAKIKLTKDPITIHKPDGSILKSISSLETDRDAIIYIKSDVVDHYNIHLIQKSANHH